MLRTVRFSEGALLIEGPQGSQAITRPNADSCYGTWRDINMEDRFSRRPNDNFGR